MQLDYPRSSERGHENPVSHLPATLTFAFFRIYPLFLSSLENPITISGSLSSIVWLQIDRVDRL